MFASNLESSLPESADNQSKFGDNLRSRDSVVSNACPARFWTAATTYRLVMFTGTSVIGIPVSNRLLQLEYWLLGYDVELRVHLHAFVPPRMNGGILAFDGRWLLCV